MMEHRFVEKLCTEIERSPNGRRSKHLANLKKERKKIRDKNAETETRDENKKK
jgi:hypothetical protein